MSCDNKYYIKTYGCQMNEQDSQQMGQLLAKNGYLASAHADEADVIIINTCSVREKPAHKLYSDVGRFRKLKLRKPDTILAVAGCQAQADGASLLKRFKYLDIVLGPDRIADLPKLLDELKNQQSGPSSLLNYKNKDDFRFINLVPEQGESKVSAFVNIMKGCDNFCSFCIVPYTRGREVSRPAQDILNEISELANMGVKEITLLGQNVNSYGNKLAGEINFSMLLRRIASETTIKRLRFTTSHPKDFSEDLFNEYLENPILAPQLHLPVQSGSNQVLARMYRGYTKEEYVERILRLRQILPDLALSTDIIVGFPGESDADFLETVQLIKLLEYDSLYSFAYSPRPKTTASRYFADDVPKAVKDERLQQILALQNELSLKKNRQRVGMIEDVLIESYDDAQQLLFGRSAHNRIVHVAGSADHLGEICKVKITRAGSNSLNGELIF